MRAASLTLVLALLAPFSRAAEPSSEFAVALREARGNVKTPVGAKYDEAFGKSFAEKHSATMSQCTKGRAPKEIGSFDVVARVASDGKLEVVLAEPRSKVSECLRTGMAGDEYPAPPRPHYWVHVHMAIRE